jgi:hypothetical protein
MAKGSNITGSLLAEFSSPEPVVLSLTAKSML